MPKSSRAQADAGSDTGSNSGAEEAGVNHSFRSNDPVWAQYGEATHTVADGSEAPAHMYKARIANRNGGAGQVLVSWCDRDPKWRRVRADTLRRRDVHKDPDYDRDEFKVGDHVLAAYGPPKREEDWCWPKAVIHEVTRSEYTVSWMKMGQSKAVFKISVAHRFISA